MAVNVAWQELYQVALLTLHPEELRQRIDEAEESIRQRIAELRRNDSAPGRSGRHSMTHCVGCAYLRARNASLRV